MSTNPVEGPKEESWRYLAGIGLGTVGILAIAAGFCAEKPVFFLVGAIGICAGGVLYSMARDNDQRNGIDFIPDEYWP